MLILLNLNISLISGYSEYTYIKHNIPTLNIIHTKLSKVPKSKTEKKYTGIDNVV